MDKMDPPIRAFFLFIGAILWLGIWLSGFDRVHWVLYLPATFFVFSAITGICPGMLLFTELFRGGQNQD